MSVWIVVGGQFGSEGKGKISAQITLEEEIDICIRCGGPNSGHSVVDSNGDTIALRQIPTGYLREKARLLIPAGGVIDLTVLKSELEFLRLDSCRVGIDRRAMTIADDDRVIERDIGLATRLSSTLSGVGSAVARRVLRSPDVLLAGEAAERHVWLKPFLTDVSSEANAAVRRGSKVLIEGTQGAGLSLYHSPYFPKATSRDTNAAGFLSEVGLSPLAVTQIVLVLRTFPIRVAGTQAGPLENELTWEELQAEAKYPYAIAEYTTVTGRLRRVGRFDLKQVERAVEINRPTKLAVNFLDYLAFGNRGVSTFEELTTSSRYFLRSLESQLSIPICYIGAGPSHKDSIRPSMKLNTREQRIS